VSQIDWLRVHPVPLRSADSITALFFPPCLPYPANLPSLFSTAYMGYVWNALDVQGGSWVLGRLPCYGVTASSVP
jgi:hypothetical protein